MEGGAHVMPVSATEAAAKPTTPTAALAALGIVYGDLGTSPLYTYQTIAAAMPGPISAADAIGLLSLVTWALLVTVSVKYCLFVMRADNHGEGGILALMSLVTKGGGRGAGALVAMGLFGAALIYGDGVITPAISVLSALEGVNVATEALRPYVLPAALVILLALFAIQTRGTASIGRAFGPVMLAWFVVLAVLGLRGALRQPEVLWALDPRHAVGFLLAHGWRSFVVVGGVFLAITGGEALYADMGHIGRNPIRSAWYCVVLPALLLNYAGQTALLVAQPGLEGNPFFRLAPDWAVVPLVVLATLATIIASQAIITGAFSLTRQAMQLGWFPGLNIRQTSDTEYGQIYVPFVNWAMMLGTLALAYGFGSSDRLAGAYGAAVSTTMLLTTALLFNAMRDMWHWPPALAVLAAGGFLVVDLGFFAANLLKLREGGWIPLVFGAAMFAVMLTWRRGIDAVSDRLQETKPNTAAFVARLKAGQVTRVPGTVVFFSRADTAVSPLMLRHVAQFRALQQTVVSLTVRFEQVPRVAAAQRAETAQVIEGLWHITVRFGFVEVPNLTAALACAQAQGCPLDLGDAIYIAARDAVVRSEARPRLPGWQRALFAVMYRNAVRTPDRFALAPDRFLEIERQVAL